MTADRVEYKLSVDVGTMWITYGYSTDVRPDEPLSHARARALRHVEATVTKLAEDARG